jgi:hypothetical protein
MDHIVKMYSELLSPIVPVTQPFGAFALRLSSLISSCPDPLVADEECWRSVLSRVATLRGLVVHKKAHLISSLVRQQPSGQTLFSEILEGLYDTWVEPKLPPLDCYLVARGYVPADWIMAPKDPATIPINAFLSSMKVSVAGVCAARWLVWRSWPYREDLASFHLIARNRAFVKMVPWMLSWSAPPSKLEVFA